MPKISLCGDGFVGNQIDSHLSQVLNLQILQTPRSFMKPYNLNQNELNSLIVYFNEVQPDIIINVAGPTNIQESFENSDEYTLGQFTQVHNHVEVLKRLKFKPIYIYLSSGSVYGSTIQSGATESDIPKPISPYAEGKILAEEYLLKTKIEGDVFHALYIFRGFSLYSSEKTHRLLKLIDEIYSTKIPPVLFGTGNEIRDFVSIKFFCEAIKRLLNAREEIPSGVYNLSSGVGMSIIEICEIANSQSTTGKSVNIEFNGIQRIGDPSCMVGVNFKMIEAFSLQIESPSEGIRKLFFRSLK